MVKKQQMRWSECSIKPRSDHKKGGSWANGNRAFGGILAPLRASDAIQAVQTKRVTRGNARMLEVLVRVAHTDALHDGARPLVVNGRERHDFGEPRRSKPTRSAARAASAARPLPQYARASRQPISTQGENGKARRGTVSPMKPMNWPDSMNIRTRCAIPMSAMNRPGRRRKH
jgi:hypothetical protein